VGVSFESICDSSASELTTSSYHPPKRLLAFSLWTHSRPCPNGHRSWSVCHRNRSKENLRTTSIGHRR
jgi:hypothetical protein